MRGMASCTPHARSLATWLQGGTTVHAYIRTLRHVCVLGHSGLSWPARGKMCTCLPKSFFEKEDLYVSFDILECTPDKPQCMYLTTRVHVSDTRTYAKNKENK